MKYCAELQLVAIKIKMHVNVSQYLIFLHNKCLNLSDIYSPNIRCYLFYNSRSMMAVVVEAPAANVDVYVAAGDGDGHGDGAGIAQSTANT